ncbi:MAG: hypothetical protein IKE28_05790 [Solobacterium sp.]|nr:hypothetical protein [Solobacterium sp.]
MDNKNVKQLSEKETLSSEELEATAGGWIPEPKAEQANKLAKEFADFFHSINIPDNSRETVKKYVNNFWVTPIPKPFCYTGIAGLYNPLTNFCITKDDIIDLIQKYV